MINKSSDSQGLDPVDQEMLDHDFGSPGAVGAAIGAMDDMFDQEYYDEMG